MRGPPSWRRSSRRWRARARPRTGSGCRRSSAPPPVGRRARPASSGCSTLQVAVRPGRPALPAAARSARRRPLRRVRAPRGRRRAAGGQVERAARRWSLGLALTHTPAEIGVHVLDFGGGALRAARRAAARRHGRRPAGGRSRAPHRRRAGRRARPSGAAVPRGRGRRRWRRSARAAPRGSSPTSPPPTSCSSSTATSPCARSSTTWRPGSSRWPRRAWPTACTWPCRPRGGRSCGPRSRTCSARGWSCGWASPPSRRSTGAAPPPCPPVPGHGLAPDGAPLVLAAPRGAADADAAALVAGASRSACHGPGFAPVRLLPSRIDVADLPPGGPGIPLGVDEDRPRPRRAGSRRRAAPGVLRRRRERQDHAAAARRAGDRRVGARRSRRA